MAERTDMMDKPVRKTLYADMPAWAAWALLLAVLLLVALPARPHASLSIPGERHWGQASLKQSDATLYSAIETDMAAGKGYYEAAAAEQRARGYPTSPAQVFREPALAFFLAALHFYALQLAALFALYGAILLLFFRELVAKGKSLPIRIVAVAAAVTGLSVAGITDAMYWHEVWAALLIAASLLSYRPALWWPAVLLGLLACLVREIAAPYLLVMAAFSLIGRRWTEFGAWMGAMLLFAAGLAIHLFLAASLYRPGDIVSAGWLALGGWDFAIATAKWNIALHMMPDPLVALAICLSLLGLAGTQDARARRAAVFVAVYLAAFLVIGRPDNYYWGVLYAPLLPMGFILAPAALRDLVRSACSFRAIDFGKVHAAR